VLLLAQCPHHRARSRTGQRAEIEGRADDNEETIRERMRVYDVQTKPLLDYYSSRDLLVEVAGSGTVEEVSESIVQVLSRS
jgi:adenylate kinase